MITSSLVHSRESLYRPDIILFLILIPFISAFNYYLTYSGIQFSWFLLLTFTIDTVQGYLAWWGVRLFILYLDVRLPLKQNPGQRLALQLSGTMVIGLGIISLLTELVSWIARGRPAPLSFYTVDLFIISIWFFVINGIYTGLYFYNLYRISEQKLQQESLANSGNMLVRQGKSDLKVPYEEIGGLYVDGEYVVVWTTNAKKFYLDQSLDKVENKLPKNAFFRLNRQYLLHRQLITGFRREENGKLSVFIKPGTVFPETISVSRTKAPSFKTWFRPA